LVSREVIGAVSDRTPLSISAVVWSFSKVEGD
jgi:hypothetical protein